MSQAFVSVKNLAAYCLDYARLIAPTLQRSSSKTDALDQSILSCESLFDQTHTDEKDDKLVIPFNLSVTTEIIDRAEQQDITSNPPSVNRQQSSIESNDSALDISDSTEHQLHLKIAQQLEDLNRKYLTASFTKELRLEFGFINFLAHKLDHESEKAESITQPLFSLPVQIIKTDRAGKRSYLLAFNDEITTINLGFLSSYLPSEYYDQLFTTVATGEGQSKNVLPIDAVFLDELWSQIKHFLALAGAEDIADTIDFKQSLISLQPRSNYFLSQDLQNLSELDEQDLQDTALSAWTSDEQMSIKQTISDNGDQELFFPFAYDKWQLQVVGILENKAALVEGPPGTGKSQTIANLLCHIAAQGKTVLFVSQKDQAVRGVKDKLKTLAIPSLYGYIPDRNSVLHSEEDEIDSASHSLVALAHEWNMGVPKDPTIDLQIASSIKPQFIESIDRDRNLFELYEQLNQLEVYNFDNCQISQAWWENYTTTINAITKIQAVLKDYGSKHEPYITELDHRYAILETDTKQAYESIKRAITAFDEHAFDRSGFKRTLKDIKLKQSIRKVTSELPNEIYETVTTIAMASDSKALRRSQLLALHNYFVFCHQRDQLDFYIQNREQLLESGHISAEDIRRLEHLTTSEAVENVFASIEKRREIREAMQAAERFNTNTLRSQIMKATKQYTSDTSSYIANRIHAKLESVRAQKSSRATLERIARSLNKSKRAFKTFDRLKSDPDNFNVMSAVVPIWMMSLDDASRILPMQKCLFDYVIVDEASQCNIAYALPVMYRARHIVFFGDSLQMRDSTTLFKTNEQLSAIALKHSVSDEYQIKATEDSVKSVMDIATLAGFQKTTLQYHYRSPKELIGFSNDYIYKKNGRGLQVINDNRLVYENTGRVMVNHLVEPRPDMDISEKTNIAEAFYIKQLIAKLRADDATKDCSIAVLAFFNEQAELLRQVIEDPHIKVAIIDGIQGDERDIIIYSFVITSPDQKNRYVALTGEGGEQRKESNEGRVNVAFSRAKLQVHAITSLQPYLWPEGVWIKKYLQYIDEFGTVATQHHVDKQIFDSDFEEHVYSYLARVLSPKEYLLRTQVKSCGFSIDLVIQNIRTGKRLAIECDGPTHFEHGDGQVYVADDYEREAILETAGWEFYRISYFDWQEHREDTQLGLAQFVGNHFVTKLIDTKEPVVKREVQQTTQQPMTATKVDIPDNIISSLKGSKSSRRTRL